MASASARRGALIVFVLLGALHAWSAGDTGVGIDFYQFWSVGQAVREGLVENVYSAEAWPRLAGIFQERAERDGGRRYRAAAAFRREGIQTSNTPFLYAAFHAFESGDYEKDIRHFRALSLVLAAASVIAICALAGIGVDAALIALAFLFWAFVPLHYDLAEGNVNAIQLGCMALFLLIARAGTGPLGLCAAGAILGAGVAFKPNLVFVPAALALAWILERRWSRLAAVMGGAAAGGAAAAGWGALFFGGVRPWLDWLETVRHIQETFGSEVKWGSFGGGRLLLDLTGWNLSPLLYLACFTALGLAVRWRGGRTVREGTLDDTLLVVGLGPLIPILAADLAWPHYLVQALPLALVLLAAEPFRPDRDAGRWLALAGLAGICSPPFVDWIGPRSDYLYAVPLACGSLLLFIAGCLALAARARRGSTPAVP